jgi:hypothetical protein
MSLRITILYAILAGFGWTASQGLAAAGSSCESLRTIPGNPSRYKDRGNRCEGLYEADVGAKSLALISLTFGTLSYRLQSGEKLELSAPNQSGDLQVRAVAKPLNAHYQMDAVLTAHAKLIWPVDDVLLPEGFAASRVGVFAWKGSGSDQVFVPVRAVATGSNSTPLPPVLLTLRPSFDTQAVKWRWATLSRSGCGQPGPWQDVPNGQIDAGQSINIGLAKLAGPNCLDVAAQASSGWANLPQLRVELPQP